MFVGHALLAFALVASLSAVSGVDRRRALTLGALAGAFATVPDVDIAYALVGVVQALGASPMGIATEFWQTGNLVHRTITHSLVIAVPTALAAALWVAARRRLAVLVFAALVVVVASVSGLLGGVVVTLFALATIGVARITATRTGIAPRTTFGVALAGLVSHPFGDLFTGEPPAMLYPLDLTLVAERIALSADPTLHLLGAFGIELAAIWAGVAVFLWLSGRSLRVAVSPRAGLGAGYAASAAFIPAPTLEVSYPFVFSVIAVGAVGLAPRVRLVAADPTETPSVSLPDGASAVVTGLTAVTVAGAAYAVAYLSPLFPV